MRIDLNTKQKSSRSLAVTAETEGKIDHSGGGGVNTETSASRYKSLRKKYETCKICQIEHTYYNRWTKQTWPSHKFMDCPKFKNMSSKLRAQSLEKFKSCARCTSWSHA